MGTAHRSVTAHHRAVPRRGLRDGFTLFELVLVLMILALMATLLVPSLRGFGMGRSNANAADLIVALARDARTQSVSEARTYRLNFDSVAGQVWLTRQEDAGFVAPPNDLGKKFDVGPRVTIRCDAPTSPDGQYIEFRPTGRTDQATVTFTNNVGDVIQVGCLSATEEYHVLTPNEAAR